MLDKYTEMTPALYQYMVGQGARQDELLARVQRETAQLGDIAVMQIAPDEGALLTLLVRLLDARRALEIGTFTGYSAICIARGLAEGGELICCEISDRWAEIAGENLAVAGLSQRVDMRVGPALSTLRELPADEPFDFVFIDADKVGYRDYYEESLAHLRVGGLIVLDNVLMGGRVLEPAQDDDNARALRELNAAISVDERVDCAMVAVADGLTIVRKRK